MRCSACAGVCVGVWWLAHADGGVVERRVLGACAALCVRVCVIARREACGLAMCVRVLLCAR